MKYLLQILILQAECNALTGNEHDRYISETSSADSPPTKKKPCDKDSSAEEVFESETTESPRKETNDAEPEPSVDDTSGPDLTCSEQLPTNCASPDPYTGVFTEGERFYRNGVECESVDTANRPKEKDSSSSLDEAKVGLLLTIKVNINIKLLGTVRSFNKQFSGLPRSKNQLQRAGQSVGVIGRPGHPAHNRQLIPLNARTAPLMVQR